MVYVIASACLGPKNQKTKHPKNYYDIRGHLGDTRSIYLTHIKHRGHTSSQVMFHVPTRVQALVL